MENSNASTAVAVDFPLHPNLIGKLSELNNTLSVTEGLILSHIKLQESQSRENIDSLFAGNTALLTDVSSPWNGFTHRDIKARLSFLKRLLETLEKYKVAFARLQWKFTFYWRQDPRYHISLEGKTHLTEIHGIWKKVEGALSVSAPKIGPFALFLKNECDEHTKELHSAIGKIRLGVHPDHRSSPEQQWIELDVSQSFPSVSQQPDQSNILGKEAPLDVESGELGNQSFWRRWHWFLWKEIQLIFASLLFAILYSVLKADPQTGFQIAAFLFTIGTASLTVFHNRVKQRENQEAKIRLQ